MLADDDNMADVWYNIGQVAIGVGDLGAAAKKLLKAMSDAFTVGTRLGGLAYQAFKIAISVDPNHAESYNNIGVLELRKALQWGEGGLVGLQGLRCQCSNSLAELRQILKQLPIYAVHACLPLPRATSSKHRQGQHSVRVRIPGKTRKFRFC